MIYTYEYRLQLIILEWGFSLRNDLIRSPLQEDYSNGSARGRLVLGPEQFPYSTAGSGDARKEATGQEVMGGIQRKEELREPRWGGWVHPREGRAREVEGNLPLFLFW